MFNLSKNDRGIEIGKKDYPEITQVVIVPLILAKNGYRVWYWFTDFDPLLTPARPFLAEFWEQKAQSVLFDGLFFPKEYIPVGKNRNSRNLEKGLIIFVTQTLSKACKRDNWMLTSEEIEAFYKLVLEQDYIPDLLRRNNKREEIKEYFDRQRHLFQNFLVPKRDKNKKYYRMANEIDKFEIMWAGYTSDVRCPTCETIIDLKHGPFIGYELEDDLMFTNYQCFHCGNYIGIRVASPLFRE